jgi:hypothetical protein
LGPYSWKSSIARTMAFTIAHLVVIIISYFGPYSRIISTAHTRAFPLAHTAANNLI